MTEQELRQKIEDSKQVMSPLVETTTKALIDAYQKGLFDGIELCTGVKISDNALEESGIHFNINLKR